MCARRTRVRITQIHWHCITQDLGVCAMGACACTRVRACVLAWCAHARACACACVRGCVRVRVCACACVGACVWLWLAGGARVYVRVRVRMTGLRMFKNSLTRLSSYPIYMSNNGLDESTHVYLQEKTLMLREIQHIYAMCKREKKTVRLLPIEELRRMRDCRLLVALAMYERHLEGQGALPVAPVPNCPKYDTGVNDWACWSTPCEPARLPRRLITLKYCY